jgi:hypothetical protein
VATKGEIKRMKLEAKEAQKNAGRRWVFPCVFHVFFAGFDGFFWGPVMCLYVFVDLVLDLLFHRFD